MTQHYDFKEIWRLLQDLNCESLAQAHRRELVQVTESGFIINSKQE